MPASCLRATQRTAYLAADSVASFNHDLLSWNGARFNNSLHDGWRGEEIKKAKGRKTGIRWSNFTSAPGGFRRLHSPRGASSSGSIFPGPADPTPPPAQPLRPGAAVFKLAPSGREWRGGLGAGANGGAAGWAFGQGRGRETGWREGGKGESGGKKKSPARRKVMDHAGRRHESRRFKERYSVPGDWLSPAVSARTDAAPGIKASAAPRAGEKLPRSLFRRGRGRGPGGMELETRRRPPTSHFQHQCRAGSTSLGGDTPTPAAPQIRANAETTKSSPTPPIRDWKCGTLDAWGRFYS